MSKKNGLDLIRLHNVWVTPFRQVSESSQMEARFEKLTLRLTKTTRIYFGFKD